MFQQISELLPWNERPRMAALLALKAAAWMFPTPIGVKPLSNDSCRLAHRLRLGLQLADLKYQQKCRCGDMVTDTTHMLSCRSIKGGSIIRRHNQVVNTLVKYIRRAGGIAVAEPSSVDTNGRNRVNIDAYLGSRHYHIDVRITNPRPSHR